MPTSFHGASVYSRLNDSPGQQLDDSLVYTPRNHNLYALHWSRIIDELLRIRTLKDDWDEEGTEAPHPALVDAAIALAKHFQNKGITLPDRVHASVNATVYFEWHSPVQFERRTTLGYSELEVVSPDEAELRSLRPDNNQTEVIYLSRRRA